MAIELTPLQPVHKRRISTLEMLIGKHIPATKRVQTMSAEDYESFAEDWATNCTGRSYERVRLFAGAGDKGRDVVGYYADGTADIYQCKHYDGKVAPTTLYPELGKLCYYTFQKDYPIPKRYYIVAPEGCGPDVLDFIGNPENMRRGLIANWDKYCKGKITKSVTVVLDGDFKKYVDEFDFSIVKDVSPMEMVEQYKLSPNYPLTFGGGLKKYREIIPEPDEEIQPREQLYTTQLFEVYAEETNTSITDKPDLITHVSLHQHFVLQRKSFFSAESLEKFGRENFPEADPVPFDELKEDAYTVLQPVLELTRNEKGYNRVLFACKEINQQPFSSNPLEPELKPLDKNGLCHHLVNDGRINWIKS